ncbi:transcriptional regulator [Synechocystis salina LEGE 06155]|nr:transcriptional regulator [Synechocystis salina LEGE 06155]
MKAGRFLLLLGILVMLSLELWGLVQRNSQSKTRPGWQIIRPPHEVSALVLQDQILWAGGKDGVVGIDTQKREIVKTITCDPPVNFVQALVLDQQNWLWIAHNKGLSYYDGQHCQAYQSEDSRLREPINTLYLDRQGQLWIGTWQGAAVKEKNGWRWLGLGDGLPDLMINVIAESPQGGMWFGSAVAPQGGLNYCLKKTCQKFSTSNGLPHNSITSLWIEDSDKVWVGTGFFDRGGAALLEADKSGWTIRQTLTRENGLAGAKVRSIYQDRQGVLWFGSENDGLARLAGEHWLTLTTANGLANQEVKVMLEDQAGNFWIGTKDGVNYIPAEQLLKLGDK